MEEVMKPEVLAKADKLIEGARAALFKGGPRGIITAHMFCGSYEPLEKELRLDGEHGEVSQKYLRASADSGQLHAILVVADMKGGRADKDVYDGIKERGEIASPKHLENILLAVLHTPTETHMRRLTFKDKEGQRLFSDAGWEETKECGGLLSNPWKPTEIEAPVGAAFVLTFRLVRNIFP
jgi:hypothetical protein